MVLVALPPVPEALLEKRLRHAVLARLGRGGCDLAGASREAPGLAAQRLFGAQPGAPRRGQRRRPQPTRPLHAARSPVAQEDNLRRAQRHRHLPLEDAPRTQAQLPAHARRASAAWARLIRQVYEADPLTCPECQSPMRVVALIEDPAIATFVRRRDRRQRPARSRIEFPIFSCAALRNDNAP